MSLSNGEPLPVKEKPTLFLESKSPVQVAVSGNGVNASASFEGVYRLTGLEKGDYLLSYGGARKTVRLEHDELVDMGEGVQSPPAVPPWVVYLVVACISAAGICIALSLAWTRR
jgi:hypothetical protein